MCKSFFTQFFSFSSSPTFDVLKCIIRVDIILLIISLFVVSLNVQEKNICIREGF